MATFNIHLTATATATGHTASFTSHRDRPTIEVLSDSEGEEEGEEIDQLKTEESDDEIIILDGPPPSRGAVNALAVVGEEDVTPSRAQAPVAPQLNSPRAAVRTSTPTNNTRTASANDAHAHSSTTFSRKNQKRRRPANTSDSEDRHQPRPVKQPRSRAPSPPSVPSPQSPTGSRRPPRPHASPLASSSSRVTAPVTPRPGTSTSRASDVRSRFELVDRETLDKAAALIEEALTVLNANNRADSGDGNDGGNAMDVDDDTEVGGPGPDAGETLDNDALMGDVSSTIVENERDDPAYNFRRSKMFLRVLRESERALRKLRVPASTARASKIVPHTSSADDWTDESRDAAKPKSSMKKSSANFSSTPSSSKTKTVRFASEEEVAEPPTAAKSPVAGRTPSAGPSTSVLKPPPVVTYPASAKPPSYGKPSAAAEPSTVLQPPTTVATPTVVPPPMIVGPPPAVEAPAPVEEPITADPLSLEEERKLIHQAKLWAAITRGFISDKATRALNHDALLDSLHDASGAGLSARVLVDSRLYAALKRLAGLSAAEEMFKAVGLARTMVRFWERKFGEELKDRV